MSKKVVLMKAAAKEGEESEGINENDPHYWLDLSITQQISLELEKTFSILDSTHADAYHINSQTYREKLAVLDHQYQDSLKECVQNTVITSHNAFAYTAKRYNFTTISITGLDPEAEPSAKKLAELTDLAKQKNIHYVFFETLVSPKLSDTLAEEIGAKTLVFNPLEGLTEEEISAGKNYLTVMQENLQNLRTAMSCK